MTKSEKAINTFDLDASQLPAEFENGLVVENQEECYILCANLKNETDIAKWILEFSKLSTWTQWNSRRSRHGGQKIS